MTSNELLILLSDQTLDDIGDRSELDVQLREGFRAHQAGNLKEALLAYQRVLEIDAGHADGNQLFGCIAFQPGNLQMALGLIKKAIGKSPTNAEFCSTLGSVHEAADRQKEALERYGVPTIFKHRPG